MSVSGWPVLPAGVVTFLFTDIEGSTRLWEVMPEAMRAALARHDAMVRGAIGGHGGVVVAELGDGMAAAFPSALGALGAALDAQRALSAEAWGPMGRLRVRMGVHTDEAVVVDGQYLNQPLNRCARIMAAAHGGQLIVSASTAAVVGDKLPDRVGLLELGAHRLRDLAEPVPLFQVLHPDLDRRFPPLRSVDSFAGNLPSQLSSFVGRDVDVAAVADAVRSGRLVTLTGTGGVGKTRLALQVAAEVLPMFADGAWLVELAAVATGDDVVAAVAASLRAPSLVTTGDALVGYLAQRRLVVVLDNCEHLLDSAAGFAEVVLARAPEVHLIATSREPLGVDGEVVRRVRSLDVPTPGANAAAARHCAAVQLFVDRAAAGSDGFALSDTNVDAVVDICRRLDGIPLAIELAAARVGGMSPADIARRLNDRFRLLSGGGRRAQERHRTLLATVSWSHALLSEPEQRVFRRLAVFPATFDLAAAEAVCADTDQSGLDVVDLVVGLVARSLIQHDPDSDRYSLLETLRQYGADRLADAGETDPVREAYAAHYLQLAADTAPGLHDHRFAAAYALLLLESDNFSAVASWLAAQQRWGDLADLAADLALFGTSVHPSEGYGWCRQAIDEGGITDPQRMVDALGHAAHLLLSMGEYALCLTASHDAESLAERHGLQPSPWAMFARSLIHLYRGELDESLAVTDRYLSLFDRRQDLQLATVWTLAVRTNVLAAMGRHDDSELVLAEALERAARLGHPGALAAIVIAAAQVRLCFTSEPDFDAGLAVFDAYPISSPALDLEAWFRCTRGFALFGAGRPGALHELAEASRLADRSGGEFGPFALEALALGYAEAGNLPDAALIHHYATRTSNSVLQWPVMTWIRDRIDTALAALDVDDRRRLVTDGPALSRRDIMAIVNRNDQQPHH